MLTLTLSYLREGFLWPRQSKCLGMLSHWLLSTRCALNGFCVPPLEGKEEEKIFAGSRDFSAVTVDSQVSMCLCKRLKVLKDRFPSCTCLPGQVAMNEKRRAFRGT